ncbi:MAG TPA: hypothetical protein VGA37_09520 [Gemmatimonadales bacterium]
MEGVLAIVFLFGGGSMFLLAISPIGRAIATRIQRSEEASPEAVEHLEAGYQAVLDDVEALRHDLVEVQERLDFAERLLAQQRQAGLPSGDAEAHDP